MNESSSKEPTVEEMITFLRNHFRYSTMNSWNKVTSYARNIKIYRLGLSHDQESKAYDLLGTQGAFDTINQMLEEFAEKYGHQYQIKFNGRSDGYLVLIQGGERPSGYQSYCKECGTLNFKKVLPRAETPEDELRNFIRSHNLWVPEVYMELPEIKKLCLGSREVMAIILEIKAELRKTKIGYTYENRCGVCGKRARVNLETEHLQIYTQPGKGMDEDADFEDWQDYTLKSKYQLIKHFDKVVDECIANFKYLIDNFDVVEREVPCTKKVRVLEPKAEEGKTNEPI